MSNYDFEGDGKMPSLKTLLIVLGLYLIIGGIIWIKFLLG